MDGEIDHVARYHPIFGRSIPEGSNQLPLKPADIVGLDYDDAVLAFRSAANRRGQTMAANRETRAGFFDGIVLQPVRKQPDPVATLA